MEIKQLNNLKSKQASKVRLGYMDAFRGLGIITMVMGHVGFGSEFGHFIHAFHMPMFFYISGFFYNGRNYSDAEYYHKKVKSLLVPYFSFGIGHYLLYRLAGGHSFNELFYLFSFNTISLPIAGALWFLTALFFTDIIYFLLDKYNMKWLILPLVLAGSFMDQILQYPLPWALSASFVGLGLYWLGEMSRKYEKNLTKILNMKSWQILIAGIIITVLIYINGYIDMRSGCYAIIPLFWTNAIMAIFIGISISKLICKTNRMKYILKIGENSITYVCLNQLTIKIVSKILSYIHMPIFISHILCLLISMIILGGLARLFAETWLSVFIGKQDSRNCILQKS